MGEELHLVNDLALILISAGIMTLIFKKLKQPLVLGYIVAGFLVGPHFDLFPTVIEKASVSEWSEIGIIFLLFALGLEFSFKKLFTVGSTAFITAGFEIILTFCLGMMVGYFLGWSRIECIFLGGMLSMSSTTIVIKAFEDLKLKNEKFADISLVVLIIQDLVAILMLVLLPTIAIGKKVSGAEMGADMLFSITKMVFFLILWFLIGIYVFPTFFKRSKKIMNDETLLIISVGLCFGMVWLATYTGFSSAFGAFIMGSILCETVEGEHIEHNLKSIKDLFGAIFFVSVGMMVDPKILAEHWVPILILSLITIFGKALVSAAGVVVAGKNIKIAMQTGFSLAQVGEFAFIIAGLGNSLGVMNDFIYPVIVTVSVITTFTTPYGIRLAEPMANFIEKHLPPKIKAKIDNHTNRPNTVNLESDWKKLIKYYSLRIVIYSIILTAISLAAIAWLYPFTNEKLQDLSPIVRGIINFSITLLIMMPFLGGLVVQKKAVRPIVHKLWTDSRFNRGGIIAFTILRFFIAVAFVTFILFKTFTWNAWVLVLIALAMIIFTILSQGALKSFSHIEQKFLENMNAKTTEDEAKKPIRKGIRENLSDHDIALVSYIVPISSELVGFTIKELNLRQRFGINIVRIERHNRQIALPAGDERIYPNDRVVVIGTDAQNKSFADFMKDQEQRDSQIAESQTSSDVSLESFVVEPTSPINGKSLKNCGARALGCMIVGVTRGLENIMNPDPSFVFETDDVVWAVGEKENIKKLF
ncbi:MAG: cation:proton antiporter [Bacteroidales bacterium]|nr:cation:proton antiporter [Bacteroidales bacterium]